MKEEVIKEHHINDELIFWPDIAFCHYAKQTIERLQIENIPCLSKGDNPPYVPLERSIEEF